MRFAIPYRQIDWAYEDWTMETIDYASKYVDAHGMPDDRCWLAWTPEGSREI